VAARRSGAAVTHSLLQGVCWPCVTVCLAIQYPVEKRAGRPSSLLVPAALRSDAIACLQEAPSARLAEAALQRMAEAEEQAAAGGAGAAAAPALADLPPAIAALLPPRHYAGGGLSHVRARACKVASTP